MANEIWVLLESDADGIKDASVEVLSEAAKLSGDSGKELVLLLTGDAKEILFQVQLFGASRVYQLDLHRDDCTAAKSVGSLLEELIHQNKPDVVLASETVWPHEVLAEVASSLKLPYLANCVSISWDSDAGLQFDQHWYNDRVSAILKGRGNSVLAGFRVGLFNIKRNPAGRQPKIIIVDRNKPEPAVAQMLEFLKADPGTVDLTDAEIIVAGGRGMGTSEDFQMLWELADLLGAAVGGTRVARDNGWIPLERQIGQTGKVVAPKLIMSCGISGAMQHTFGMKEAKTVIAINKDKNAPIFKLADVGIVGDVQEVIPALIHKLSRASGQEEGMVRA